MKGGLGGPSPMSREARLITKCKSMGKHDSVERATQHLTGPWLEYIRAEAGPEICLHTSIMHARPGRSLLGADLGTRGKALWMRATLAASTRIQSRRPAWLAWYAITVVVA